MSETSFASLNPALLARKGGAKPAMRPQLGPIPDASADKLEDLGWNDMGQDGDGQDTATILQLDIPKAANEQAGSGKKLQAKKGKSANSAAKRAAFTLRLDPERHLKLRLASTMQNRSAQQLVTEALDALLAEIDELDSLAAMMQRN
ncbi:MAG TPA: hypothetical protein DCS24_04150 [Erythrobacter sp.]|nr:hypothetical protein [Erythrobacter sp.]